MNSANQALTSSERFDKGWRKIQEIDGGILQQRYRELLAICLDFARHLVQLPFGDIYSRPALDNRKRELAIVSAMAALNAFATFGSVLQSTGSPCAGQA
ncbi:MAG: hypothetical protein Q8Q81_08945 [Oxalobacteraceae bacterium]|nr:hypothetical protein [Oxalobacteraceae bacterium]